MTVEQKQRLYLGLTMILVAVSGIAIALYVSYQHAFEDDKLDLANIVQSRARIMESVARFDAEYSSDFPGGTTEATLSQVRDAHEKFEGFGETGEFTLAKLDGEQIVYLLRHRHSTATATATATANAIPLNASFAEPMRRALKGESGVLVGLDYRGVMVLAAYEPVAVLNLGLVAKIDLAEIKAPFIKAGFMAGSGGLLVILVGSFIFFRLSEPLIRSIKELQERYEMAVRGSKDGLWDWPDVNKDEQWWSDEWYVLLGLKRGEIESNYSGFKSLLHSDDLPRMEEALKNHFYGHEKYDVEFRLKHKSGEYRWFRSRGAVQRDKDGKAKRMSGSISDTHDQRKNSETIDKLSQVAQQIPISVVITDHEGNIEFGNEALLKLSGYSADEVLGQNPRMFKSGESPDTYYKVMWETIALGKEWRGVFHNKKKNGELYWESVLIFPLKDINGKVSNFIGLKEDITEKKQMESTLIDHERLIRSVINNLNDGLIIANVDGNIQLFNHGAEKIFGYKAEEVMNKPVSILRDDSYKEKHEIGFARFQKTHKIAPNNTSMEVVGKSKDGAAIPIELTLTQMEQRGELLVVGLIHDITERKEAERQRREAEAQLGQVLEGAEIYFWDWNIKTDKVIHDPRWAEFLGYDQGEIESTFKQCAKLAHPDDLPKFQKALDDHIQGKSKVVDVEYRVLKKSGEYIWVLDKGKVLTWDDDGKPLRAYGTYLNIQDRKEAEESIRAYQKRNEMILGSAAEGIYGLDLNGITTFVNTAAEKMLGYSLEDMLNCSQHDLIHHSKLDGSPYKKLECPIYAAIKDGEVHHVDSEVFWKKNGDFFPVEYTSTPIYENGAITGAVVTFRDITEKKEAEERMELAQKQVIASQKLAGVGELAAGVSHEVLNPVNIISVHTQMLQKKTKDDPKIQNFCEKVRHEIDRIQKIMGSLLAFSRSGSDAELQRGSLRGTIEGVLALVEEEYKLDNIKIVRDWCGELAEILFDADKIRQVYLNLIHNAKHAMPDGGTITVGCASANNGGKDYHQFTFSDTGTGMSEEVRLKIFEPFFTTKPEGEGTGMGLSVIHGIVEEHGGKIRVESEEGKGTTFTISLPVAN